MKIVINDDFDLFKIVESGQCFRPQMVVDNIYRFIYKEYVLYIKNVGDTIYEVSCTQNEWNNIWVPYFDLNNHYQTIRDGIPKDDKYMRCCAESSKGIRILIQDKWEMLISYIISQRKSIPAIRSSIEKICKLCGDKISTEYGEVFLFPSPKQLSNVSYEELSKCGLGYRIDYIIQTSLIIADNELLLEELSSLNDEDLVLKLIEFKGVGKKVANCVMLFAYNRTGRAPVDVWIQRVIDEHYNGTNPFEGYGEVAGIMQQYVFFYRRLIEM